MDEKRRRRVRRGISLASAALVTLAVGLMLWCAVTGIDESYLYDSVLAVFVLVYCFLLDYLEPRLCGEFDGITPERKKAYQKFAVLDVAGYMGLAFFLLSLGDWNGFGIIGLAVYVLGLKPKKEARYCFYGLDLDEEDEEDAGKVPREGKKADEKRKSVLTEDDPAWLRCFEEDGWETGGEKKASQVSRKEKESPEGRMKDSKGERPAFTEPDHSCKIIQMPVRRAGDPKKPGKR